MYSFQVVAGGSPAIVQSAETQAEVQQFLSGLGLRHAAISQKTLSLRKNPEEEVYIVGRDKNQDIVGIGELTVEYKLTHCLSKAYHFNKVHISPGLASDASNELRVAYNMCQFSMEKFSIESLKSLGGYKIVLCQTDSALMQQAKIAGYKDGQIYMELAGKPPSNSNSRL